MTRVSERNEGGMEGERDRQTNRQTDRQTQTQRQRDRGRERDRDRDRKRDRNGKTDRQRQRKNEENRFRTRTFPTSNILSKHSMHKNGNEVITDVLPPQSTGTVRLRRFKSTDNHAKSWRELAEWGC